MLHHKTKEDVGYYNTQAIARTHSRSEGLPSRIVDVGIDREANAIQLVVTVSRPSLIDSNRMFWRPEDFLCRRFPCSESFVVVLVHDLGHKFTDIFNQYLEAARLSV